MRNINFNKLDGIIWDMDGVLIDVSKSYRKAILKTAQYFCRNKKLTTKDVNQIKQIVGLNNDWDASFALILLKNKNLKPEEFVKNLSYYRKRKQYQEIKNIFQDFYLKKGLINFEKLLITKTSLQKLKAKYQKMAIVTGRPEFEAKYSLEINNIKTLFKIIITMEDTNRSKPYPDSLLKAIKKLNSNRVIYIGDSPSDVLAAQRANIGSIYLGKEKMGTIQVKNINQLLEVLL